MDISTSLLITKDKAFLRIGPRSNAWAYPFLPVEE